MAKYEYYLKFWGGATPTIAKELGIIKGDHWFDTKEERAQFYEKLKPYSKLGLVHSEYEGEHVRKQTFAIVNAKYKGEAYAFEYNFGYAYPVESAEYMFLRGNYACDCNLSIFIREECPGFPELDCGTEIEYTEFEVIQI